MIVFFIYILGQEGGTTFRGFHLTFFTMTAPMPKAKDPIQVSYQLLNLSIPILHSGMGEMITGWFHRPRGPTMSQTLYHDSIYNLIPTSHSSIGGTMIMLCVSGYHCHFRSAQGSLKYLDIPIFLVYNHLSKCSSVYLPWCCWVLSVKDLSTSSISRFWI